MWKTKEIKEGKKKTDEDGRRQKIWANIRKQAEKLKSCKMKEG